MLEVRKNTFSRNYENSFFREISRHLFNSFKERNIEGVLIGSPFCEVDERLQIDALLITPSVVCIIDFKNFKGKINLPDTNNFESGCWTTKEGDLIKGGSSINPYMQLRNQKRRFIDVANKYIRHKIIDPDIFNPLHSVRAVCFQDEIELNGEIPRHDALNFFILDKSNFIEKILDIVDVTDREVILSQNSFNVFKSIFLADPFKIDNRPLEDKLKDFAEKSETLDYSLLHPDQNTALSEIKSFLEDPDQNVFILQGTTNSGKSFLIPYIQDIAFKIGVQETEIFASSSRVANNLMASVSVEKVNSIYSYIYGGKKLELNDENKKLVANEEEQEGIQIESVPLKSCDNAENALFIIDETQLVSDSFYQSLDLIFGSGYLLKDFIRFTDFENSKRKIILIGDPYQLHIGRDDETPLNPSYLEDAYSLKTNAYQLLDKPDFSVINKEALFCVDKIRTKYFNSLQFVADDNFCFLQEEDVTKAVAEIIHNKTECHILCFSNEESQKVNYWIKQSIIKNGEDIALNDLLLFNNNISIEDINDPFSEPKKIYNGQFATITGVNNIPIEKTIKTKKNQESTVLTFREISLTLNETGQKAIVLSLENYRVSAKAELSKNEIVAFKILLNSYIAEYTKLHPFENTTEYSEILKSEKYVLLETEINDLKQKLEIGKKVKTKLDEKIREQKGLFKSASKQHRSNIESTLRKDPTTEYYKFKNSALLRFGWAMTVHKSMSYKWQEVIFNVEKAGTTNESHFRWLYTGISRAWKKVSLINYKPISPFDKTEFVDSNTANATNEFFYIAESQETKNRLTEFKHFVLSKLNDIEIERVENLNWQERYHLKSNTKTTIISFSYNGQGKFKFPTLSGGDTAFGNEIIKQLKSKSVSLDFGIIKDLWRKTQYEKLSKVLKQDNVFFSQIIQTNFKDRIKLFSKENEEIDLEFDYNGDGAFSKITAKYYSNHIIWEHLKNAIGKIKS